MPLSSNPGMGRPLEFDRDQALAQAMDVFWLKGYDGTSLQDLLEAMHLSKSSFYQSFHSKHELFLRTITLYRQQVSSELLEGLERAPSGRHFIEAAFSEFTGQRHRLERQRGCFVVNCANEFAQHDPDVSVLIMDSFEQFEAIFYQALVRSQREGDLAPEADLRALARYLVTSRSGLKTMAKAGASPDALQDVVRLVFATLGW